MCTFILCIYVCGRIYIYMYIVYIYIYPHWISGQLLLYLFEASYEVVSNLLLSWKKDVYICDTMLYAFSGSFERIEMQGTAKPCPAIASPARGHSTGNPLTSSHVAWQQDFGRIWTAAGPNQSPQCFTERAIDSNHVLTKLCLFNHCLRVAGKHQPATQGGTGWRTEPRTSQL